MQKSFSVDVPFEIPTLRFVLEHDHRGFANGRLVMSCYFDKGRSMYGLALLPKSIDDVGRCGQLLATAAAWTVEVLERWPRNDETGGLQGDMAALNEFLGAGIPGCDGRPLFAETAQGQMAMLDSEDRWRPFL